MTDCERLVKFNLLGQDFSFYTAASEQEMGRILELVRQFTEIDIGSKVSASAGKVAILGCLNLASQYVELEREYGQYRTCSEEQVRQLTEKIKRNLTSD